MTTIFVNCDVFSPISNKQTNNLALVIPFTFVRYTLNKNNLSKMHAYIKPLPFDFFEINETIQHWFLP
jgi:glycopeptide antibiotics resistance protein